MADLRAYCGVAETQLTIGAAAAATSITLDNLVDIYNNTLTMADFGTKGFARINPDGDNIAEDISFTGITANVDGTFTLTGVSTILAKAPYTETSGLVRSHGTGSPVRFSNVPAFYNEFTNKNNDETIAETWTFSNTDLPRLNSYVAPTADEEFATKKYVDDTAGGTPVSQNRIVVSATAGETVADGQAVYLDETDNEWKLADASASATCDNVQLGIAQGAGTDGNPITGGVLLVGRDDGQSGLTQGDRLYISDTAGAISSTPGTVEVEIGHAVSATTMDFSPKFASYTTKLQRNALVGTSGTPNTGNEYVTANDQTRNLSQVQYATSTSGNDTYAVTLSPAPTAYTAGMEVAFKPDTANTGACTLNVNGLGAKAIKVNVSDDPQDNTIKANSLVVVRYDGTNFQLISTDAVLNGGSSSDADSRHNHPRRLETITGSSAISNTTTETDVISVSLAGNQLSTDNYIKIKLFVSNLGGAGGATLTLRLKYGSTTICTDVADVASISNNIGYVESTLFASGATNTQEGSILFFRSSEGAGATVGSSYDSGTGAEDSTGALTLKITAQWNFTDAANTVTFLNGYIEIVK